MACRLFGAKPFSEPTPDYYEKDQWEGVSLKKPYKQMVLSRPQGVVN